jgi:hypothetical protein
LQKDGKPLLDKDGKRIFGRPLLDEDGKRRYGGSRQALSYQVVKPLAGIDGKRPLLYKAYGNLVCQVP